MHTTTTAQDRHSVGAAAFIAVKAMAPIRVPSARRLAPAATHVLFGSPELTGITVTYDRNGEIYGEGEGADYVYKVISGAVRTYKVLNDGRRQINAFYLPDDCFGLELGDEHTWSAEAIVGSTVAMVKRSAVLSACRHDGEVARQLWSMTAGQLDEAHNHALLLIKSAQERVAAFLLEMSKRVPHSDSVELPMGRQDIADYLGLTIETVSRTLTHLESARTIELLTSRVIALRNRSVLSRLNG
jgi:CRP/FNR family transcriptional regulator, nitrogen fixation regulation protein